MISSRDAAQVTFPEVKIRQGYEVDEVKALVEKIRQTLVGYETGMAPADAVTARELKRPDLQPTMFRLGCGLPEVDAFLRQAREALEYYENRA